MCCMATVFIVSRTQMANGICVGGINEDTGELIRLHNEKGGNLKSDAPYMVGERWNLNIEKAWNSRPIPHVEDMQTSPVSMIENIGLKGVAEFVKTQDLGNRFTNGELAETFEGCLHLEGTKNYINRNKIPSFSTQFWVADKDLHHKEMWGKHYYFYDNVRLKFVGYQNIVDKIPSGTIIRLSLANWWDDGCGEERCYLQLSGWYL